MDATSNARELVLASRNLKKSREVTELLLPHGFRVIPVSDFPDAHEVVEDGRTFAENAAKKACQIAMVIGRWTIGEDSGLVVDALDGEPGIYSARYAGDDATDERNNAKLIEQLKDVPPDQRTAHYVCSIAVSDPEGTVRMTAEGRCGGRIVDERRGENGFGYDPHFLVPEYHRTFGELTPAVKQVLSHRGRAFRMLIPELLTHFSNRDEAEPRQ